LTLVADIDFQINFVFFLYFLYWLHNTFFRVKLILLYCKFFSNLFYLAKIYLCIFIHSIFLNIYIYQLYYILCLYTILIFHKYNLNISKMNQKLGSEVIFDTCIIPYSQIFLSRKNIFATVNHKPFLPGHVLVCSRRNVAKLN